MIHARKEFGLLLGALAYTLVVFWFGMASSNGHQDIELLNQKLVRDQLALTYKQGFGAGMDAYRELMTSLDRGADIEGLDHEILHVLRLRKNCNDTDTGILKMPIWRE